MKFWSATSSPPVFLPLSKPSDCPATENVQMDKHRSAGNVERVCSRMLHVAHSHRKSAWRCCQSRLSRYLSGRRQEWTISWIFRQSFFPLAFATVFGWDCKVLDFISVCHKIFLLTGDLGSSKFSKQRISIEMQRGNAKSILGSSLFF